MYCLCESNNFELSVFFTVLVLQQKLQLHEQKCNFFCRSSGYVHKDINGSRTRMTGCLGTFDVTIFFFFSLQVRKKLRPVL